jgi:superfamily I DNA/RNA helicase
VSLAIRARAPMDSALNAVLAKVADIRTAINASADEPALRAAVDAGVTALAPGRSVDWDEVLTAIGLDPAKTRPGDPADNALGEMRSLAGAGATDRDWADDEVGLYTIFGAKGQQWDHVYLVGAYSQGFTDRAALADGLRLLYVALTRTKKSLTVVYPWGIRYTQLAQRLKTTRTELLTQFAEACDQVGITIERDPARPG